MSIEDQNIEQKKLESQQQEKTAKGSDGLYFALKQEQQIQENTEADTFEKVKNFNNTEVNQTGDVNEFPENSLCNLEIIDKTDKRLEIQTKEIKETLTTHDTKENNQDENDKKVNAELATETKKENSKSERSKNWSETSEAEEMGGKDINNIRDSSDDKSFKASISRGIGEIFGDRFCQEELGYEELLHDSDKGISQGYDAVYQDPKNGDIVVVEFKGQSATLKEGQKKESWTMDVCNKIIAREGNYTKASEREWKIAQIIKNAFHLGELRFEVVRTKVDNKANLKTKLEEDKTKRPMESKEMRQEGDSWTKYDNLPEKYQVQNMYFRKKI